MKIGIIGLGVVGNANLKGFQMLKHDVLVHDKKLKTSTKNLLKTKMIFLCVPTPSKKNGSCDISILESVVKDLCNIKYKGLIIIRSTVSPGTTLKMQKKYKNKKIIFSPEFLRERCAIEDFIKNQNLLVIGTKNKNYFNMIKKAHKNIPKNIVQLSENEAELLKYFNNAFASLRIVFANIFYDLSKKYKSNYAKIKNTYIKTKKANDLYLDVNENLRGYGGMCLPKDTSNLVHLIKKNKLNFKLIEAIHKDNNKFKKTVFKNMRK